MAPWELSTFRLSLVFFFLAAAAPGVEAAARPGPNVEVVAGRLETPWAIAFAPDGRIFFTERPGRIRLIRNGALAEDLAALNGKILRLNPDGTIPADNPFANSPVYSYGHRNPQGLAWQPGTGRLYATEHGPSGFPACCHDEVNLIEPGKNYGWPVVYGDRTREGMVAPVLESGNETWAPAGAAFVTRGVWADSMLFTGLRGQTLYRVAFDAKEPRKVAAFERFFVHRFGRLRDVAEGPDGAIYILTSNRDGRGRPTEDDDRVLRIVFK